MSAPRVLMWHGFGERSDATDPHRVFLPVETFARQLDLLVERGSTFLDLDGYLAGLETGRWPKRSVLVTIDDGYVSTLTDAAPLLAARSVPAVVFALPGRLGGTSAWMPEAADNELLDADGLRALEAMGLRVEVHGWDHRLLPGLPAEELRRQVAEARTALADVLGREPVAFAYPSGQHDAAARAAVREAGFTCAFAVHEPRDLERYALGRVDVNPTDTDLTFRLKTTRLWGPAYRTAGRVAPVRRALHRLAGSARSGSDTRTASSLP